MDDELPKGHCPTCGKPWADQQWRVVDPCKSGGSHAWKFINDTTAAPHYLCVKCSERRS